MLIIATYIKTILSDYSCLLNPPPEEETFMPVLFATLGLCECVPVRITIPTVMFI